MGHVLSSAESLSDVQEAPSLLWDTRVSLPCPQVVYCRPRVESFQCSSHTRPVSLRSILILCSIIHLGLPFGSSLTFRVRSVPVACYALVRFLDMIALVNEYILKPLSVPLYTFYTFWSQMFSSAPFKFHFSLRDRDEIPYLYRTTVYNYFLVFHV
jgi:hypothetical protein